VKQNRFLDKQRYKLFQLEKCVSEEKESIEDSLAQLKVRLTPYRDTKLLTLTSLSLLGFNSSHIELKPFEVFSTRFFNFFCFESV
jgi:hypothetical protein